MNTGVPWPSLEEAEARVLGIQSNLHRWARDDPDRRFSELYNLISDPGFLAVAWKRVRGNRGGRTAGVDGQTARFVLTLGFAWEGVITWLERLGAMETDITAVVEIGAYTRASSR